MNPSDALAPLASNDQGPVFEEGWQAQVLALAFNLVDQGHFSATQWSDALGAQLAVSEAEGEADNSDTYYKCVLRALEHLLNKQQRVPAAQLNERTEAWRAAYLRTPHGQPVELGELEY